MNRGHTREQMTPTTLRLDSLEDLTTPAALGAVSVREESLSTVGFSGAAHRLAAGSDAARAEWAWWARRLEEAAERC